MSHLRAETFKQHFQRTLDDHGIWTIYTRSDHRFRCIDCYDINTGDSSPGCRTCFGTGWKVQLERWFIGYHESLFRAALAQSPIIKTGISPEHNIVVFSRATEIPVVGDVFFLVEWTHPPHQIPSFNAQPVRLANAVRISYVEPIFAGQVIYYTSHCEFVKEANRQYERVLLRTPVTVTRE